MGLFEKLTVKAKSMPQRIVLPEGTEPRTLTAADRILSEGIAEIILIGDPEAIKAKAAELNLANIDKATIVDPADEKVIDKYAPVYYELRKKKGISMEEARATAANPLYLGCLMVKAGDADGQVAGALNTTGNVLRAAFQVIKTKPGIDVVSGAFVMVLPEGSPYGSDGLLIFADCAVVPEPDAKQLAQIAVSAAQTARDIAGIDPRVAILSFSTKGSAKSEQSSRQPHQGSGQRTGIPLARSGQHRLQARAASRRRRSRRSRASGSGRSRQRPLARLLSRRYLQDHHHHLQPGYRCQGIIPYNHSPTSTYINHENPRA